VAFGAGSLMTLLVFYLIAYRTPKHFQPYSKMLMMCAIVDMSYIFTDFLGQLVGFFSVINGFELKKS
jgi:hypothetical protein